ncbi:MAG: hypothetical protein HY365_01060 [Candidatus Aenigmarchaeota archaeon]|nr:hypothetical protein [Candidatus Aenigmarchaeota archaeon]
MPYTFVPEQKHAKAYGSNLRISPKNAGILCRAINRKKFSTGKRLLSDIVGGERSLKGKYYSKAAAELKSLLDSCEKNAENTGLDMGKLFIHATAYRGSVLRRRRRKGGFGSRMKVTNVEIMLIEKGKVATKEAKREVKKETRTETADKDEKTTREKK